MNSQDIWCAFFKEVHTISFYMDGKEASNLKLLQKKINRYWLEDAGVILTPEQELKALNYFLHNITDDFTLDYLTPSNVNSRFNILNQQMHSKRIKTDVSARMKKGVVQPPTPEQQHQPICLQLNPRRTDSTNQSFYN